MARSFPANSRIQHFIEEQYAKETAARLQFHAEQKSHSADGAFRRRPSKSRITNGLPDINPMEFALRRKQEEDKIARQIVEEARNQQTQEEMRPVDEVARTVLLDGFSREGKGRIKYLRDRHQLSPESKFTFPMVSSWEYGWKIRDEMPSYQRSTFTRTSTIKDSFYSRNGVSSLSSPDAPQTATRYISRSFTLG
jgi:hypothetical protein